MVVRRCCRGRRCSLAGQPGSRGLDMAKCFPAVPHGRPRLLSVRRHGAWTDRDCPVVRGLLRSADRAPGRVPVPDRSHPPAGHVLRGRDPDRLPDGGPHEGGRVAPPAVAGRRAELNLGHDHRLERGDRVRESQVHRGERLHARRGAGTEPPHPQVRGDAPGGVPAAVGDDHGGWRVAGGVPQQEEERPAVLGIGVDLAGS